MKQSDQAPLNDIPHVINLPRQILHKHIINTYKIREDVSLKGDTTNLSNSTTWPPNGIYGFFDGIIYYFELDLETATAHLLLISICIWN